MLKIQDLAFKWHVKSVFENINLHLNSSETLHLLGPNGSGKTTFLKVLAGLLNPSSGFFKYSTQNDPRTFFDYMSADSNGSFLDLTAKENIVFWTSIYQLEFNEQILQKWLGNNYVESQHKTIKKFSTGMQRRVAFARIESCCKRVLLLDEPTFGLDNEAKSMVIAFLNKHLQSGGSLVIVNHESGFVDKLSSRLKTLEF